METMVRTIEERGPYAVIALRIAIPRVRPEESALKPGFSIVILEKPVTFGALNNPVHVAIEFTAVDKTTHLKALQTPSMLLSNEKFVENH